MSENLSDILNRMVERRLREQAARLEQEAELWLAEGYRLEDLTILYEDDKPPIVVPKELVEAYVRGHG